MIWPPEYTIKRHPRARHVKLKTSLQRGLEITVPKRFSLKELPQILEHHKPWIQKQLNAIVEKLKHQPLDCLPDQIQLTAINQVCKIQYIQSNTKRIQLFVRSKEEIVLVGDIADKKSCKKILIRWIKSQAKLFLTDHLIKISEQTQLDYAKLIIRGQQSRWGSCSSDKSINLNYKLIFLPIHLVTHVLIHELCHTVYLNHSAYFWRKVAEFDAQWEENDKQLRQMDRWVPVWVE